MAQTPTEKMQQARDVITRIREGLQTPPAPLTPPTPPPS